ncbi:MAG: nucleotidyltransferase family protein [Thiotrichales bacterium]|nr:nucleotidyltransferase family protein [Thiotrichales bacterium]
MILAAGRGERLRPLTDDLPKPLVCLCGTPLIEYHLQKLAEVGVRQVVINHAWLGEKLVQSLGNGQRWGIEIAYSAEPPGGLETAGGIVQALPLLGAEPFLLLNGDVYCDLDFAELIEQAQRLRASYVQTLGHLILVPTPVFKTQGDFALQDGHCLPQGDLTFAGISVLHPRLFAGIAPGTYPLAPVLRAAMQQQALSGALYQGFWSDIGTLARLEQTQQRLCPDSV